MLLVNLKHVLSLDSPLEVVSFELNCSDLDATICLLISILCILDFEKAYTPQGYLFDFEKASNQREFLRSSAKRIAFELESVGFYDYAMCFLFL